MRKVDQEGMSNGCDRTLYCLSWMGEVADIPIDCEHIEVVEDSVEALEEMLVDYGCMLNNIETTEVLEEMSIG